MKIINIIQATRQLEYVCFFNVKFKTQEGPAYAFFGVDCYSQFAFSTGVELSDDPEIILKHIYLLTEDLNFKKHIHSGFTLVLPDHQELGDRINTMITPLHGKLRFDPTYHQQITKPLIESINDSMKKKLQPL